MIHLRIKGTKITYGLRMCWSFKTTYPFTYTTCETYSTAVPSASTTVTYDFTVPNFDNGDLNKQTNKQTKKGWGGGHSLVCIVWQVAEESVLGPYVWRANSPLNRVYFINGDDSEKIDMRPRAQIGLFGRPKRVQRGGRERLNFILQE